VRRPGHDHRPLAKEHARRAAHQRHQPQPPNPEGCAAEPDFRTVARKPHAPRWSTELVVLSLREIKEPPAADPAQPDVERPITIGAKRDELAIGRDGGIVFGAWEICEARELSVC